MKWSALDRAIAVWVCLIATCALVFVFSGISGLILNNSSNIASWVQAIGSIGAIGAGIWAVQHQLKEQREYSEWLAEEKERERIVRSSQYVVVQISDAMLISEQMLKLASNEQPKWEMISDLADALVKLLDRVPHADLPTAAVATFMGGIRAPVITVSIQCRAYHKANLTDTRIIAEVVDVIKEINQTSEVGLDWMKKHILAMASDEEIKYIKDSISHFKEARKNRST